MSAFLEVSAFRIAPLDLQLAIAIWCIANGHHAYPYLEGPETMADVMREPFMLVLGIPELVEWLVADGCSPALRAIVVDMPEFDAEATIAHLWHDIIERHEFFKGRHNHEHSRIRGVGHPGADGPPQAGRPRHGAGTRGREIPPHRRPW